MKPIDNIIEHKNCPFITEILKEFRDHGYTSKYPMYICRIQKEMNEAYSEFCTVLDQLVCPLSKAEKTGTANTVVKKLWS